MKEYCRHVRQIDDNTADSIAVSVAEKLSVLPFIRHSSWRFSRKGHSCADSDIDIGIYYEPESLDLAQSTNLPRVDDEHRNDLVVSPGGWGEWVNAGGWLIIKGFTLI